MIPADETFDGTWPYAPHFFDDNGFRQHYIDVNNAAGPGVERQQTLEKRLGTT